MGKRGFRPKPIEIRLADGTYRPDRHGNCFAPSGRPIKPRRLEGAAAKYWPVVLVRLETNGVLAKTDGEFIARYCELLADHDVAIAEQAQFGHLRVVDGELKLSPCVRVINLLRVELRRMEAELGLTPAGRASLHVQPKAASVVSSRNRSQAS